MSDQDAPLVVWEDEDLLVRAAPGQTDTLVVAFTGVKFGLAGVPMTEFYGSARGAEGHHILFVSDLLRSWYSRPGLCDRVCRAITAYAAEHGITRLHAVGNSMGGYGALLLSDRLPFSSVLAFAPQVSMDPGVIRELRWIEFRPFFGRELAQSVNPNIARAECPVTIVVGDGDAEDARQTALLEPAENLTLFRIARGRHNAVRGLKDEGILKPFMSAVFAGDRAEAEALIAAYEAEQVPAEVSLDMHGGVA
ncbi:alpha/beta fold hydrolase [Litorisediminicola beolgyonensis]|uniref:Alpha/beta fold hydrolase n=1 Tax=Litorisediminicola beolgyonensis TaxID=1173614 RepID=A0ABW3ZDI8_9RHOB